MMEKKKFALVIVILLSAILTFTITFSFISEGNNIITNDQLMKYKVPQNAVVVSNNNTIIFTTTSVFILIEGGAMNAPSMYSFEIYGLFNPTIVVPLHSKVTIMFVNVDTDQPHNVAITRYLPESTGMMGSMMVPLAFPGAACPVLNPLNNQTHYLSEFSFVASEQGDFYYLCEVPGHAENGMYGIFIVNNYS